MPYASKEKQREYNRKYMRARRKNPEVKVREKAYYESHKDETKARAKIYHETHKAKRKAQEQARNRTPGGKEKHCQQAKRFRLANPDKAKAASAVSNAVQSGKMPHASTKTCVRVGCDKQAEHYHHPNYEKQHRLDVMSVCRACHRETHELLKRIAS